MEILVFAVATVAALVVAALLYFRPWVKVTTPTWMEAHIRRSITIHLVDGDTVDGLLETIGPDGLVLRSARYFESEGEIRLGGEVYIPRTRIAFIQES